MPNGTPHGESGFEQRPEGDEEEEAVGLAEAAPRWRLPGHICGGPRGDLRWVRQRRQCRRRWVREVAGAGRAKEGLVGVVRPLAFPRAE